MAIAELQPDEFERVLPLYRAANMSFPLISAVIQGRQRGQVLVDHRRRPRSAIVATNFGFMFLVGEENKAFDAGLARVFATDEVLRPSYLLWYSPPAAWRAKLDAAPVLVRRRERTRFHFSADQAAWLGQSAQCPAGFELKALSADLLPETESFGIDIESRFWSSAADFFENGLGVCLVKEGDVVSICYAATIIDGLAEIDVVTQPQLRGRGLAYAAARKFIRECLSREIVPTWDCFLNNIGSLRLAARLGFVSASSYPLYSFNVPIAIAQVAAGALAAQSRLP